MTPKKFALTLLLLIATLLTAQAQSPSRDNRDFRAPRDSREIPESPEILDSLDNSRLISINPENSESSDCLEPFRAPNYAFRPNQLIAPTALIAVGSVGVSCFQGLKKGIRADFAKMRGGHYLHFDDYIQYVTPALYLGLGVCRVPSRYDFIDRLLAGTTAYLMMAVVCNTVKYSVREMRPDDTTRNSFPSGHSATAFTGAELMRICYGNYVGIAGYAVATTVGFMRMYNNRHWINDILAGAGIGILAARAAYWLLPLERKLLKRDRERERITPNPEQEDFATGQTLTGPGKDSPLAPIKPRRAQSTLMTALPYYDAANRGAGLSFAAWF